MSTTGTPAREQLGHLGDSIRETFAKNKRVLSFTEYLDLVLTKPTQQLRSSAQYIKDCFDFFGSEEVTRPYGRFRRFKPVSYTHLTLPTIYSV